MEEGAETMNSNGPEYLAGGKRMRFVAIYCGTTVYDSELLAISSDPRLVQDFAQRLCGDDAEPDDRRPPSKNGNGSPRRPMKNT